MQGGHKKVQVAHKMGQGGHRMVQEGRKMGPGGHKMVQEEHRRKVGWLDHPDRMQPRERLRGKPELLIFFSSLNLKRVQPFSKWLITLRQGVVKFPNFDNLTFCNLPVIINMF